MMFDVLLFHPPKIKKAVMFAAKNVLVCETQKDATKVAWSLGDGHRYDVNNTYSSVPFTKARPQNVDRGF